MSYRQIHTMCTFWILARVWITQSRFLKYRLMNVILCTSTYCNSTALGTEVLKVPFCLSVQFRRVSVPEAYLHAPHTLERCFMLSRSLQTPLWWLTLYLTLLSPSLVCFQNDRDFFHCSYVLGFSRWRFLTRGPGSLGETLSCFFNPDLGASCFLNVTHTQLTEPLSRTHVSKMLDSLMKIVQIITSSHCILYFWACFCFSQMLFQFSPFLELAACLWLILSHSLFV